jgi:di/tricarboxylate transporter
LTQDQIIILVILVATVAMFMWGRWRHDVVAMGSLLACVLTGLVPTLEAFSGFSHPAVITVACVLVLSRGLQTSGAVDALARRFLPQASGPVLTTAALTGLAAVLSAFMNNVGALALLMPVAVQIAARHNLPPGKVLMPLSFGSILGGMTTLIGTPPNLIVAGFRARTGAESFGMFDFTPVGLAVAAAGVAFIALIGWRLVPTRGRAGAEGFEIGAYLTEARIPEKSKAAGMTLREIESALDAADAQVIGLIHNEVRRLAPNVHHHARAGDVLIIEAEPDALAAALSKLGLTLEEDVSKAEKKTDAGEAGESHSEAGEATETAVGIKNGTVQKAVHSEEILMMEYVVLPNSDFDGRSATDIRLRSLYGINLLAVSRQGSRSMARLRSMRIKVGDVLLMQGSSEALGEFAAQFGCVPLAERSLRIPDERQALIASGIMAAAIGGAALGLVPTALSFAAGVFASMALRVLPLRSVYNAIDWPVIVLLAAMLPVGGAMESSGAADLIAQFLIEWVAKGDPIVGLVILMLVTIVLTDFMNNAATAAVMCPIAIGTASQLGLNPDPFLMAVAIGASCAFLTPIGHQNNTLILGPGGFRFGDYWRMGLPLEIIVVGIAVPMILWVWPF